MPCVRRLVRRIPTAREPPAARARAARLGSYPTDSTARMTFARVVGCTNGLSLKTRETVCEETPAALATSLRVARADMSSITWTWG
ncbi:hypothetical protein TPCV2_04150 [Cutibacterium avidum]